jgi:DNA-binding IclR family transcriptional regulator
MARPSPQTDRVIALVEALRAHPERPLTLAAVARRLDVNRSTCHAMLAALTAAGWLLRDPTTKAYRLGPALVAVGQVAGASVPAVEFAQGVMETVADDLHLHCSALVVADDTSTVVRRVNHPRAPGPRSRAGAAYPVRLPFGAAAVAWADRTTVEAWLAPVAGERRAHHEHVLALVRARGWAALLAPAGVDLRDLLHEISEGEGPPSHLPPGTSSRAAMERVAAAMAEGEELALGDVDPEAPLAVVAVQAPVLDHDRRLALVLSLTGFPPSVPGSVVQRAGDRLARGAAAISDALGGAAA